MTKCDSCGRALGGPFCRTCHASDGFPNWEPNYYPDPPEPEPSDGNEPRHPFAYFLMGVVRDGFSVKFDFNAEANAICVECATTKREAGNRRLHRMLSERDFQQTLAPDWLVKMVIRRMKEELEEEWGLE